VEEAVAKVTIYTHIYIYIERERERERVYSHLGLTLSLYGLDASGGKAVEEAVAKVTA